MARGPKKILESDDQIQAQLGLLFDDARDNIRFAKQQQWLISSYALLILAAISSIYQIERFKSLRLSDWWMYTLCICSFVVSSLATFYLCKFHNWLRGERMRLYRVRQNFSEEFRRARGEKKGHLKWYRGLEIILPLVGFFISGASIVTWQIS